MEADQLTIGFVRRGYARAGGAEAYLQRLAKGVRSAGHVLRLATTDEWPENDWPFGQITRLAGQTPTQFADAFEAIRPAWGCDVVLSLERIWQCDIYRAGDGVHRAWLVRRREHDSVLRKLRGIFNRKHRGILRLEESLFGHGGARRVIANSEMVQREIVRLYGCPADQIDVVRNGVPVDQFRFTADSRRRSRAAFGLTDDALAVLFVGSGWGRKGLKFAIKAVEACRDPRMQLLVAGRGNRAEYSSPSLRLLGVVEDLPALYAAADIFLLPTIYDPFSNASLEALAAGLPVVTTSANGFAEIVEEGIQGSIAGNPADIDALTGALKFWSDPARREAARPRCHALAAQFDISRNVQETLGILLQCARR
ncbi:MAG: glycosyltransferase family 4 protein [Chthoniobacterales bacterium]|nr:glycosyltransferase family 4 protein [Chthoniobacterales bacterium]MDQ3119173.1 glycosyltransferase family 4 protein [Verrucomicrobiota bacterium]